MAFNNLGLQEPSTITARVGTVTIARGSTTEHQEIMVLGDVSSSNAIARVLAATPASTEFGLAVRVVEQPSTTVAVSSIAGAVTVRSSAANALVTVYQSTAADLQATVAQASTVWQVQVGGYVAPSTTVNVSSLSGKVQVVNSSAADLNVTVAGYSTTVNVSSLAGRVTTAPSDTNWASSAGFHFDSSGALNIAGTFSASTTVNVSSLAGKVQVVNSSAADLNVTVAGYSTTANVSSVAGIVAVRPSDTNWASSAGFRFTSSGELQVNASFTGSTTVTVSTIQGVVTVRPEASSNSSVYMPIRISDGTSFVPLITGYTDGSTFSSLVAPGLAFNNSSNNTFRLAGLTTPFPVQVTDSSNAGVKPGDSANNAIRVNVVAGSAASTIVTVSTGSVRVHQSSAADLNVTVAGYSTTVNVSSGNLNVVGFFDSSNAVQKVGDSVNSAIRVNVVAGAAGGSTIVTISTIIGVVTVTPASTNNSSVYLPIRLTNGTAFITPATDYQQASTFISTAVVGPAVLMRAGAAAPSTTDTFVLPWASTFGAQYMIPVTDSGVSVMDSTNRAINVNVVAGAAGGSTIVTVSTGSVRVHQSTAADLQATVGQASTVWAVQVGGYVAPSTTVSVSTGSVRVHQSTAADLNVTVAGYSTTVNVSSLAGAIIMRSSAADALVTVYQSTASALLMTATIGTNLQSTAAPSSNSSGLIVRQVIDAVATFASTSALASTTVAVTSTAAGIRAYVTAYTITSTNQTPAHWGFFSSNATLLWPITLAALSSGVAGANLAVGAPGYLFRTATAEALNFKTAGSTVSGVQMGVSYYLAP